MSQQPSSHMQAPQQEAAPNQQAIGHMSSANAMGGYRVSNRTAAATQRAGSGNVHRSHHSVGKKNSKLPSIIAGLVVVGVLAALVVFVVVPRLTGSDLGGSGVTLAEGEEVTVTIPEGSGAAAIAQTLYDNGLISSTSDFLSYVRKVQADSSLQSGTYTFAGGTDMAVIVEQLQSGMPDAALTLTIPEGYTVSQTATAVEESLGIAYDDFMAQAKASNYAADYSFLAEAAAEEHDSLEGYLFPKTYGFDEGVDADTVIRTMLSQFQSEAAGIDLAASAATLSDRYGITVTEHDIVTMASIVEREAVNDDQRGKIASTFFNRLAIGMALQSDATLTYSLGHAPSADELQTSADPYNTYSSTGLTPTPVCSPSYNSLAAAANPDNTDYLYFFISADGYEAFSVTYDEHLQAISGYSS